MNQPAGLKAVLWDMDGVLVDTFDAHYLSWKRSLDELNRPFTVDLFRKTFGMNNRLILTTLFERDLPESFIQQVSLRKEELFRADIKGNAQLLPGVADWLARFAEMGIKQAVASSAPQANIDVLLDELCIRSFFQAEAAGATLKGKPDPAVFLLAAQMLNTPPANCLVIEDSIAGVEAARRGGMRCVAVLTTNPAEKLAGADVVVKDLTHLEQETLIRLFTKQG
jgi:beta-phosphoglucomutase